MAKGNQRGFGGVSRRDDAARRAGTIRRRADEEYFDEEYDEYDYDRSVKLANRGCLIAFAGVMLVAAAVLLWAFLMITAELGGKNASATGLVHMEVEPGSAGRATIAEQLEKIGLIGNKDIFNFYAKFNGTGFRSGRFDIPAGSSYDDIMSILTTPVDQEQAETVNITFPPGRTVWQYADICEKELGIPAQEFVDAANDIEAYEDIAFFSHLQFAANTYFKAEGYMAPDTYNFYVDEDDPYVICRKLYKQFNDNIEEMTFLTGDGTVDFYTRLEQQDLSLREAITLASIVEREASKPDEDQGLVAGVFWNRLRGNLPVNELPRRTLGSDVTFFYINNTIARGYGGTGADGDWEKVPKELYYAYATADDDPEVNEGLPAGPVTNPSKSAIRSALQPVLSDNFWFLTDDYGTYYYGSTWAQHSANVRTMEQMNAQYAAENGEEGTDG